jgi:hypothetical protein
MEKLDRKLFVLAFIIFCFSSGEAFSQKKGEFVKKDQLIDYSINLTRRTIGYREDSHTISISEKDGQITVRFGPTTEFYLPELVLDGGLELYFREIERGHRYIGGLKG